jgi:hypothetical protein
VSFRPTNDLADMVKVFYIMNAMKVVEFKDRVDTDLLKIVIHLMGEIRDGEKDHSSFVVFNGSSA